MYCSVSAGLVVMCIVFPTLSSAFVALRFKVRMTSKAGIGADEYTILGALVQLHNKEIHNLSLS